MNNKAESYDDPHNTWTAEQEELMAEWCDKAACYRWLHERATSHYLRWHYAISILIIILSTLTGIKPRF